MSLPQAHPWLNNLTPYKSGGYVPSQPNFWGLASNENLLGPSQQVLEVFKTTSDRICRYPEQSGERLKRAIASTHNLEPEELLLGNGSDEILALLFRAYAGEGDEIILSQNGFPLFSILSEAQGAKAVFAEEKNLTTHVDNILKLLRPKTKIICIANPNNPTGTHISGAEILRLCQNVPSHILIILDSAYAEYVSDPNYQAGVEMVRQFSNVVMTRTFSKIYGLAGLRLGWAQTSEVIVGMIDRLRLAFHVNGIVQEVAIAALQDQSFVKRSFEHNKKWRNWLQQEVKKLGLSAPATETNFLLVHFPALQDKMAEDAFLYLKKNNVLTRPIMTPYIKNCLRISTGPEEAMYAVVEKLTMFFNEKKPLKFERHGKK